MYAFAAFVLSGWLVRDVWSALDIIEAGLGVLLVASGLCGVWFLLVARRDLRELRGPHQHQARASS
jgi:hypothetical protein